MRQYCASAISSSARDRLTTRIHGTISSAPDAERVLVQMGSGVGASREEDGWGNRSSGNPNVLELSAAYDLDKSVQLRAYAGGSGGSMGVASGGEGYWRRYAGVAVTGWF